MNKNLISTLKGAGFKVVTGKKNVLMAIEDTADSSEKRCSGYGVFPDGDKCNGCPDCNLKQQTKETK